jgi:hypothetical protein
VNTEIVWINVQQHLETRKQPVYMYERPLVHGDKPKRNLFNTSEVARAGEFWVPLTPVLEMDEVQWSKTESDKHVRIPVQAYRTVDHALSSILVTGLEVGTRAMASLALRYKQEPKSVVLVVGHECTDLSGQGVQQFRCYIGLAIRTR